MPTANLTKPLAKPTLLAMLEVNVHQAKTQLSDLLRRVAAGEEVIIARAGTPVARLVPIETPARRLLGLDEGLYEVPEDFDSPLPDDVLSGFER
jgi:prevent-host-death family protein